MAEPTVVVSHLDITYRVAGAGGASGPADWGEEPFWRTLTRSGRDLTKVHEVRAVQDVSFVARKGESIGVVGTNGSGKSTLLRAVAGLIPPSAGRVWVSDRPSLLGVNPILMNQLSGEKNIYLGAQALGLSRAQVAERFDEIVDFAGIGDAVYLPMRTYSSGMAARLRFAISTALTPEVLLIDEALATGDSDFRERSARRIDAIREQAGTVFLVSHSSSTILDMCDRALWMHRSRLVMDGPVDEVVAAYEATFARPATAAPPAPDPPGVTRLAGENRFETAAEVSRTLVEPGTSVLLLPPRDTAAAMSGTAVAMTADRMVLPSGETVQQRAIEEELSRLAPVERLEARVDLQASTAPTAPGVLRAPDSASTAVLVSRALLPDRRGGRLLVAQAGHGAGSLTGALLSPVDDAVVLLTERSALPRATAEEINRLAPERITLIGGSHIISPVVAAEIEERWVAPDRVDSDPIHAAVVASTARFPRTADAVVLASATAVADVPSAMVAARRVGYPFLLLPRGEVPDAVLAELLRLAPRHVYVAASPGNVPTEVLATLAALPSVSGQDEGGLVDRLP